MGRETRMVRRVVVPSSQSQEMADELLSLLLENYNSDSRQDSLVEKIERRMEELENLNVEFDPEQCLNGPMFAVLHQKGPVPFWEKYGKIPFLGRKTKNLKGQRYVTNDSADPGAEKTYKVTNYAEFFGDGKIQRRMIFFFVTDYFHERFSTLFNHLHCLLSIVFV